MPGNIQQHHILQSLRQNVKTGELAMFSSDFDQD
jgi:hypothetical protein